jgi:hypothetical protein
MPVGPLQMPVGLLQMLAGPLQIPVGLLKVRNKGFLGCK